MNTRTRIESEALDLVHHHPERCDRDDLANAVINFVMRERAAAFEEAAAMCEELLDDERKALNAGGYIEACMEARRRFTEKANGERA